MAHTPSDRGRSKLAAQVHARYAARNVSKHKLRSGELQGPCPACGGEDRFWTHPKKGFGCRQCCPDGKNKDAVKAILRALGIASETQRGGTETQYQYRAADGTLVLTVTRTDRADGSKTFRQHPTGLKGGLPLFKLPELLLEDLSQPVYVTEGEKACLYLRAHGYNATCWSGGTNALHKTDVTPLHGRHVVLLADADKPGRKVMQRLAAQLHEHTTTLKVHLPAGDSGKDVADYAPAELPGVLAQAEPFCTANRKHRARGRKAEVHTAYAKRTDLHSARSPLADGEVFGACPVCGGEDDRFQTHAAKGWSCQKCCPDGSDTRTVQCVYEALGLRVAPPGGEPKDSTLLERCMTELGIELRYDLRAHVPQWRMAVPERWPAQDRRPHTWEPLTDAVSRCLRDWVERSCTRRHQRGEAPVAFRDVEWRRYLDTLCERQSVDPFLLRLRALPKWDGVQRIARALTVCLGADTSALTLWASRMLWLRAVERAVWPGAKQDQLIVLLGTPGLGKSAFLEHMLWPDIQNLWYTDDLKLGEDRKMMLEATQGRVVVECGELAGLKRTDWAALEAYITRTVDSCRLAYARRSEPHPRRWVLAGTTNDDEAVPDSPGMQRRMVMVHCVGPEIQPDVAAWLAENRDQCWAEALACVDAGESGRMPRALKQELHARAKYFRNSDPEVERWAELLERKWHVPGDLPEQFRRDRPGAPKVSRPRIKRAMLSAGYVRKHLKAAGDTQKRWWYIPNEAIGREPENQQKSGSLAHDTKEGEKDMCDDTYVSPPTGCSLPENQRNTGSLVLEEGNMCKTEDDMCRSALSARAAWLEWLGLFPLTDEYNGYAGYARYCRECGHACGTKDEFARWTEEGPSG